LSDKIKKTEMDRARRTYGAVHTGFWWGNLREVNHSEDPGLDGRVLLKLIFEKWDGDVNGPVWLRIGTADGLL
jgi:hypothetical protein